MDRIASTIHPRYRALVLTAAWTGARFGELAALRVRHVDLEAGTMRIEEAVSEVRGHLSVGPPKTEGSAGTIALPRFLCEEVEDHLARLGDEHLDAGRHEREPHRLRPKVSRRYRDWYRSRRPQPPSPNEARMMFNPYQDETHEDTVKRLLAFDRERFGDMLAALEPDHLVFPSPACGFLSRTRFGARVWRPLMAALDLQGIRFHQLRNFAASISLRVGGDPKTVQARLRHATSKVTMDVYAQSFPGSDGDLAERLDELYRGTNVARIEDEVEG